MSTKASGQWRIMADNGALSTTKLVAVALSGTKDGSRTRNL